MPTYVSDRGVELLYHGDNRDLGKPVLTVEQYPVWCRLYVVHPDGRVAAVRMDDLPGFETAWRDDCPHPVYCLRYAAAKRWLWDETSLDAVYGRFARRLTTVDWGEGDPDGQKA